MHGESSEQGDPASWVASKSVARYSRREPARKLQVDVAANRSPILNGYALALTCQLHELSPALHQVHCRSASGTVAHARVVEHRLQHFPSLSTRLAAVAMFNGDHAGLDHRDERICMLLLPILRLIANR